MTTLDTRRLGAPRYELHRSIMDDTYTVNRVEQFGPFATREEAKKFMLDTQDDRKEHDGA